MKRFHPIKIAQVELNQPIPTFDGLEKYIALKVLVRLHGVPLGFVQLGITNGRCTGKTIQKLILKEHGWTVVRHLLNHKLASGLPEGGLKTSELMSVKSPAWEGVFPSITVVICTRNRDKDLDICLNAFEAIDYPNLEIMVVDNAPNDKSTADLVRDKYPHVRYVCEPRPGLSWARNRGIQEATGEIIAFTDDDVVVDPEWLKGIGQLFADDPRVMAMTGLVIPFELETDAQILFEMHGGFTRGFERNWYNFGRTEWQDSDEYLGAGKFGSGANMAFRRRLFEEIGYFEKALGAGSVSQGGEDLEMFYRLLRAGHTLVYEPRALVFHRHRREYDSLKKQITNNGIGLAAYHLHSALRDKKHRFNFMKLHIWWFLRWHLGRLFQSLTRPHHFPTGLIFSELVGYLVGPFRYLKARRHAKRIPDTTGVVEESNGRLAHRSESKNANEEIINEKVVIES